MSLSSVFCSHSLASIPLPDTVAITFVPSLDRISPVRSSPRADRHMPFTLPSHRMARRSGSPAPSVARKSLKATDSSPSARNMTVCSSSPTPSESSSLALSLIISPSSPVDAVCECLWPDVQVAGFGLPSATLTQTPLSASSASLF